MAPRVPIYRLLSVSAVSSRDTLTTCSLLVELLLSMTTMDTGSSTTGRHFMGLRRQNSAADSLVIVYYEVLRRHDAGRTIGACLPVLYPVGLDAKCMPQPMLLDNSDGEICSHTVSWLLVRSRVQSNSNPPMHQLKGLQSRQILPCHGSWVLRCNSSLPRLHLS